MVSLLRVVVIFAFPYPDPSAWCPLLASQPGPLSPAEEDSLWRLNLHPILRASCQSWFFPSDRSSKKSRRSCPGLPPVAMIWGMVLVKEGAHRVFEELQRAAPARWKGRERASGKEGREPVCVDSNSRVFISSSLVNMLFEAAWRKKLAKMLQPHKCESIVPSIL